MKTQAMDRFYALQYLIGLSREPKATAPHKWSGSVRNAGFDSLEFRVTRGVGVMSWAWVGEVVIDGLTIAQYHTAAGESTHQDFARARAEVEKILGKRAVKIRRPDIEWEVR
jgi:hypothetical protein